MVVVITAVVITIVKSYCGGPVIWAALVMVTWPPPAECKQPLLETSVSVRRPAGTHLPSRPWLLEYFYDRYWYFSRDSVSEILYVTLSTLQRDGLCNFIGHYYCYQPLEKILWTMLPAAALVVLTVAHTCVGTASWYLHCLIVSPTILFLIAKLQVSIISKSKPTNRN